MLLPADLLSSTLMPWAMVAPALPLIFMLFARTPFTGLNVSILLSCIVTMLTNMIYSILPKTPISIRNDIHLVGIIIEYTLSLVLIWNLVKNGLTRKVIIAVASIIIGGLTLMMLFQPKSLNLNSVLSIANLCIAMLAGASLYHISETNIEGFLTVDPGFWTAAGIAFHFGLMALLLLIMPEVDMKQWGTYFGFSLLFVISNGIRHAAFATAVHVERKKQSLKTL
jgi:hypothetical protein